VLQGKVVDAPVVVLGLLLGVRITVQVWARAQGARQRRTNQRRTVVVDVLAQIDVQQLAQVRDADLLGGPSRLGVAGTGDRLTFLDERPARHQPSGNEKYQGLLVECLRGDLQADLPAEVLDIVSRIAGQDVALFVTQAAD
jgi:hypothetical protein